VLTSYLLTLGSLLVLGGSLGDLYGRRRVFLIGLAGFAATSALCGAAPTLGVLVVARALQGAAGALLVPGSLAMISASFHPDDRAAAIGTWSGLGGIAIAAGPFVGGWLIDAVSWRAAFFVNLPLCALAGWIARRHAPETRNEHAVRRVDVAGALTLTFALGAVVYALIDGADNGWSARSIAAAVLGGLAFAAFLIIERRIDHPMVPLAMFANRQFSGANAVTLVVYAALGAVTFLLVVHLQRNLGYSALEAGAALLPTTVLLLLFSARSAAWAQRIGPRIPMTIGPLVVGAGMFLLGRTEPGHSYVESVLPGALVFGAGLVLTVAPLTATVLAAVEDERAGVGSAVNNAVARVAGLLAVAVIPAAAGITSLSEGGSLADSFSTGMVICGGLAALGGVVAFATIRNAAPVATLTRPTALDPCGDPCLKQDGVGEAA
jgi:EmrB/QacA subfamily drug resistance transporter